MRKGGNNAHKITYQGITLTIPQWIDKFNLNINKHTLWQRIIVRNWPLEEAFFRDGTRRKRKITTKMIDNGVEAYQELMLCRGYFRKENRIKTYKMLNTWYKEFLRQDMKAA